ncbi:MAG: 4Fe-4S dicluster domain-containing protein [Phycisphaerales bacterium]|nr:MAG: 4Fe-4S dicluster domain-containing protein [Phycisphaerales bacterium]
MTENPSRRTFLKTAALAGVYGSVASPETERAMASETRHTSEDWMGVLVDLTKCNGCRQCEAACQEAAGFTAPTKEELLDESVFNERRPLGPRSYTMVNRFDTGTRDAEDRPVYVKMNCMHCNDPACVSACLVGAMRKEPNGAVSYDAWKCMGCRYCMVVCPFEMPTYEYDDVWTPQVRKCTLCSDNGNPNKGGTPACVQVCPKQCLIYGKRSELLARAHDRIRRHPDLYVDHVYGEHEAGGTSWLYISGVPFEELGFLKVNASAPPRLSETIQHGVFNHFIPPIAWCGILGLAMWLTKPNTVADEGSPSDGENKDSVPTLAPRRRAAPELEGQPV